MARFFIFDFKKAKITIFGFCASQFFLETAAQIFLKFCMKLQINKSKISTRPDFLFSISKRLKSPFLDFVRHSFFLETAAQIFLKFYMKLQINKSKISTCPGFDFRFQKMYIHSKDVYQLYLIILHSLKFLNKFLKGGGEDSRGYIYQI